MYASWNFLVNYIQFVSQYMGQSCLNREVDYDICLIRHDYIEYYIRQLLNRAYMW